MRRVNRGLSAKCKGLFSTLTFSGRGKLVMINGIIRGNHLEEQQGLFTCRDYTQWYRNWAATCFANLQNFFYNSWDSYLSKSWRLEACFMSEFLSEGNFHPSLRSFADFLPGLLCISHPIISDQLPCCSWRKATPWHDAATTILHSGNVVSLEFWSPLTFFHIFTVSPEEFVANWS